MNWRRQREQTGPTSDEVDAIVARNVPLAARLDPAERVQHRDLTAALVRTKRWEPVADLSLSDEIRVTVAANAAIPILHLGIDPYRTVQAIIVRPTTGVSHGVRAGRAEGTVADEPIAVIGQAAANAGPLVVSWDAALAESRWPARGRNVVIHEFAHKIDMGDGYLDGTPPLRGDALSEWTAMMEDEFGHTTARPSDRVLGTYAWTNAAEFFAVATERFFCRPAVLSEAKPVLYEALRAFYRQDPARSGSDRASPDGPRPAQRS
ncbi:MAG: zinc-dependent peptidase [Acidimicrobiales bacterium]